MNRFAATVVALLGLILLACAHVPRTYDETDAVKRLRLQYVRTHPNGRFNAHILKGEVTKGMDFLDVLASWGLPNLRRGSRESVYENWVYYARDEETGRFTVYELVFKDQHLVDWKVDVNVAGNGGKPPITEDWYPRTPVPGDLSKAPSTETALKKKQ